MPELHFQIQWPDGEVTRCYSPSTVVREYFQAGMTLTVAELAKRSSEALERASDRVQAKFGVRCSSAAEQREAILTRAGRFDGQARVTILSME